MIRESLLVPAGPPASTPVSAVLSDEYFCLERSVVYVLTGDLHRVTLVRLLALRHGVFENRLCGGGGCIEEFHNERDLYL